MPNRLTFVMALAASLALGGAIGAGPAWADATRFGDLGCKAEGFPGPGTLAVVVGFADATPEDLAKAAGVLAARVTERGYAGEAWVRDGVVLVLLPSGLENPDLWALGRFTIHLARRPSEPGPVVNMTGPNGEPLRLDPDPIILPEDLEQASLDYHPMTGRPVVNFSFTADGARHFAKVTGENIGRLMAVVVDGEVVTAATIQSAIPDGQGFIDGAFSVEEATSLARRMDQGTLPGVPTILETFVACPGEGR